MKKKESMAENQSLTCPNPSCGKIFANPIKTEDKSSRNVEVYNACPFCLTEITLDKEDKNAESVIVEEKKDLGARESENEREEERHPEIRVPDDSLSKVQGCSHHLGYLSQRSSKEKIPEECMVCENIVQCMLKNVTS